MKIAEQIRKTIDKLPTGEPFGYAQLKILPSQFSTAAKAIERLQKKGEITKISKGIFFKPKQTALGALGPNYVAILTNYLFKNNKRVGYITGVELYNSLNLTTQIAFKTKVATNVGLKKIELGWLKSYAVKAYAKVTEENYKLLGYLDVLKDILKIPDSSPVEIVKIMRTKILALTEIELKEIIKLALKYPPRVRALLGAILEDIFGQKFDIIALKKSLNPASTYKLSLKKEDLGNIQNWNIK